MHQHEHQHVSNSSELHVLVHSGLKAHFESPHAPFGRIRAGLDRVDFVDDEDLIAPGRALALPVLLPVTSEFQAEGLSVVRVRHPLALLVAVTNDVSGFRTYYAIRSGADFVFNMAIASANQVDMLYAQLRSHCTTAPPEEAERPFRSFPATEEADVAEEEHRQALSEPFEEGSARPVPVRQERGLEQAAVAAAAAGHRVAEAQEGLPSHPPHSEGPAPGERRSALPSRDEAAQALRTGAEVDTGLMRMLCSSMTVTEIARRYYCSERTMYRRIRKLYDDVGVRSRAELIPLASVLALSPARASASLPPQRDRKRAS